MNVCEGLRKGTNNLLSGHRIRYYGLLASGQRAENVARARELLMPPIIPVDAIKAISPNAAEPQTTKLCPCSGGRMIIIERFERGVTPQLPSKPAAASNQDRHVMIPSLPINEHCQTYSRWLADRGGQARIHAQNRTHKYPAQATAHSSTPTRSHRLYSKIVSARVIFSACT
jgi:hypothetical protein